MELLSLLTSTSPHHNSLPFHCFPPPTFPRKAPTSKKPSSRENRMAHNWRNHRVWLHAEKRNPEKFAADRMTKYTQQDVFKTSLIGEPVAVLCGSAGHKFLSSNKNKLVTIWFPPAMAKVFPSAQKTPSNSPLEPPMTRKLAMGFLKPDALQSYVKVMDSIAKKHFETKWDLKKEVTVAPLAKDYTFEVACGVFLSIEDPKRIASFAV